ATPRRSTPGRGRTSGPFLPRLAGTPRSRRRRRGSDGVSPDLRGTNAPSPQEATMNPVDTDVGGRGPSPGAAPSVSPGARRGPRPGAALGPASRHGARAQDAHGGPGGAGGARPRDRDAAVGRRPGLGRGPTAPVPPHPGAGGPDARREPWRAGSSR